MKLFTIFILLVSLFQTDPRRIAKINAFKKEAEKAFQSGDFQNAIAKYTYLKDSMKVDDDNIMLNIAHAKYQLKDSTAQDNYQLLASSENKKLRSVALQQLGVINKEQNKLKLSADYLKKAIKADHTNKDARFNYEVVKKLLNEQEKNNKNKDDKNQDNKDQDKKDSDKNQDNKKKDGDQNQEKQDQKKDGEKGNKDDKKKESEQGKDDKKKEEGKDQNSGEEEKDQAGKEDQKGENQQEKKDQQQDKKDASKPDDKNDKDQKKQENSKLSQKMNSEVVGIPEEKAKAILEAMRQNEIKYLQNKRRKPTKQPSNGKPDW